MKSYSISDMKAGYFIGDFTPSVLGNCGVELSVKDISKGRYLCYHREVDTQYIVVLKGEILSNNNRCHTGTIIIWKPFEEVHLYALENSKYLCVKLPGTKGDMYTEYRDEDPKMAAKLQEARFDVMMCSFNEYRDFPLMWDHNKIDSEKVSVVIQGQVDREWSRIALRSIRNNLPGAKIILSTWEGSDSDGLCPDVLVKSEDPGGSVCGFDYWKEHNNRILNNCNRQIISTRRGLEKVNTEYVLKLRSDQALLGDNILRCFDEDEEPKGEAAVFRHKLVVGELYSREYYCYKKPGNCWSILPTPFHISDWFVFGKTEDVRKIYDNAVLMTPEEEHDYPYRYSERLVGLNYACSYRYPPEQHIMMGLIRKYFREISFEDLTDWNERNMDFSRKFARENFRFVNYIQSQIYNLKYESILMENNGIDHLIPGLFYADKEKGGL